MAKTGNGNGRVYRINFNTRVPTAAFYDVTQEMAADFMENHNNINRDFRNSVAERYARDRVNEKWLTTHQAGAFDWNGEAIDGQHRFTMIIRTGLTTRMLIVTGLDPAVRMVTDIGAKRSPADVLQLIGRKDANVRTVAVVRQMMNGTSKRASIPEIVDAYDLHCEAAMTAINMMPKQNQRNITISPIYGVIGRASYTEDVSKLEEFSEKLYYGKGEKGRAGDKSVVMLHKFLKELPHRGEGLSRIIYGYTEMVLAAFLANEFLPELIMPEEEMFALPDKLKKAKAKLKIVHPMKGLAKTA